MAMRKAPPAAGATGAFVISMSPSASVVAVALALATGGAAAAWDRRSGLARGEAAWAVAAATTTAIARIFLAGVSISFRSRSLSTCLLMYQYVSLVREKGMEVLHKVFG
jgi:hypothetical protein